MTAVNAQVIEGRTDQANPTSQDPMEEMAALAPASGQPLPANWSQELWPHFEMALANALQKNPFMTPEDVAAGVAKNELCVWEGLNGFIISSIELQPQGRMFVINGSDPRWSYGQVADALQGAAWTQNCKFIAFHAQPRQVADLMSAGFSPAYTVMVKRVSDDVASA